MLTTLYKKDQSFKNLISRAIDSQEKFFDTQYQFRTVLKVLARDNGYEPKNFPDFNREPYKGSIHFYDVFGKRYCSETLNIMWDFEPDCIKLNYYWGDS